ncbi:hypothetical protein BHE97_00330 [Aeromicrobium sp. PE09-221]|nr:hypothetical protein BHE97_00330 [Aeromicrobium sp. PE09-221]
MHLDSSDGPVRLDVAAVVVDCDGLLMDSESVWLQMVEQWLAEHGECDQDAYDFLGLSVDDTALRLLEAAGCSAGGDSIAAGELVAALSARYSGLLTAAVRPMPGARELIASLAGTVPIAVASNGSRQDVTRLLDQAGILAMVETVCTIEDVVRGKPAPDIYEAALRRLDVDPMRAVALEDSPHGASAARAAGLTVVGVNPDPTIEIAAHHRLGALDQISVIEPGRVAQGWSR